MKKSYLIKMHKIDNQYQQSKQKPLKGIISFIPIVAALLFCMIPNYFSGIPYGSDEPFHLARILSLADALREGIFPVKVHPNLCYGFGYGVGFFYDNAILYFPALLILAGASLEIAYKIFIFFVLIAIAMSMYYSCKRLTEESLVASFSAALYLLSNRIVGQLYVDFTIGNLCGAIFFPFAVAGIYIWIRENKGLWMFIIGFTGLLYSHAISTLLAFSVCILIIIVNLHVIFKEIRKLFGLALASVFVILITMSYWLPMLQQFHAQMLKSQVHWTTEEQNVISISGLITDTRGIGILMILVMGASAVIARILARRHDAGWEENRNGILIFLVFGVAYTILPCIYPFWHWINMRVTLIQFPARLFLPASVLIIFSFSMCLSAATNVKNFRIEKSGSTSLCMALCAVGSLYICFAIYPNSFLNTDFKVLSEVESYSIAGAGAGQEWLPIETNLDELKGNSDLAISEDGNYVKGEKKDQNSKFVFQADSSHSYYDVPYIYYRGYIATDNNGTKYEVDKDSKNGLVRVMMPKQDDGIKIITVTYCATKYAKTAYLISACTLVAGIVFMVITQNRRIH